MSILKSIFKVKAGKLLGAKVGFLLGGPPGALIGAAVGALIVSKGNPLVVIAGGAGEILNVGGEALAATTDAAQAAVEAVPQAAMETVGAVFTVPGEIINTTLTAVDNFAAAASDAVTGTAVDHGLTTPADIVYGTIPTTTSAFQDTFEPGASVTECGTGLDMSLFAASAAKVPDVIHLPYEPFSETVEPTDGANGQSPFNKAASDDLRTLAGRDGHGNPDDRNGWGDRPRDVHGNDWGRNVHGARPSNPHGWS